MSHISGNTAVSTVPWQFHDPAFRYVPLHRGTKIPLVKDEWWQHGLPYADILGDFFAGTGSIPDMASKTAPGVPVRGGDIGVRLERSGLLVIDADVKRHLDAIVGEAGALMRTWYEDGRQQFLDWHENLPMDLPPTFTVESAGRPDGDHLPGWHLYYRQCPTWPVRHPFNLASQVELKVNGIVRYTDTMTVMRDLRIAEMPEQIARLLQPVTPRVPYAQYTERTEGGPDFKTLGLNNALTGFKGYLMRTGLYSQEEANEVVRFANRVLADPIPSHRLENTVLKEKYWA